MQIWKTRLSSRGSPCIDADRPSRWRRRHRSTDNRPRHQQAVYSPTRKNQFDKFQKFPKIAKNSHIVQVKVVRGQSRLHEGVHNRLRIIFEYEAVGLLDVLVKRERVLDRGPRDQYFLIALQILFAVQWILSISQKCHNYLIHFNCLDLNEESAYVTSFFGLETIDHKLTDEVEERLKQLRVQLLKLFHITRRNKILNQTGEIERFVLFDLKPLLRQIFKQFETKTHKIWCEHLLGKSGQETFNKTGQKAGPGSARCGGLIDEVVVFEDRSIQGGQLNNGLHAGMCRVRIFAHQFVAFEQQPDQVGVEKKLFNLWRGLQH